MKLRLFGLAAAYTLAGTLCVAAQDGPKDEKRGGPQGTPAEIERSPDTRAGPSDAPSDKSSNSPEARSSDEGSPDATRAEKRDRSAQSNEKGDNRKKASDAQKAEDKRDRGEGKKSAKSRDDDTGKQKAEQAQGTRDNQKDQPKKADEREAGQKQPEPSKDKNEASSSKPADSQNKSAETDPAANRDGRNAPEKATEAKNVQLSQDKRERVQSALKSERNLKRETKVNIDISIGSRAPREWSFAPVPVAVIEVVPEYRGYLVAYVEDEYVICDPNTYEIVAVLPVSGGGYASAGGSGRAKCSETITLNDDERREILRSVQIVNEVEVSGVSIGWSVPNDIELRSFPDPVVQRWGKLQSCRYFVVDDQIAIVDPDGDKVVFLVEPE